MTNDIKAKIGFGIALLGLALTFLSFAPGMLNSSNFPWPFVVGSFLYLGASLFLIFVSKGQAKIVMLKRLRMIRVGFVLIVLITMIMQMSARGR